jgi:pimeloyl-ACP methyl ester carboxylesterase
MTAAADPRWWGNHLAETRWIAEASRLMVDPVFLPLGVARGDGRPVILLPGFMAGDQTLAVLAGWLWRLGYRPYTACFISNVDCSDRAVRKVERRVRELHDRHGRRVAVVGHSRGGHFARALGARAPELVSHAISMGADLQGLFGISTPTEYAVAGARRLAHVRGHAGSELCFTRGCDCAFMRDYSAEFPDDRVRLTTIYSQGDGVVRWERCLVPYGECVEVSGSHTGLVFNRQSYRAIATALAQPELKPEEP